MTQANPRKPVFDAIRAFKGSIQQPEAEKIDALLSALGFPEVADGSAFDRALTVILRHEGGWSNNSQDPGGMTNLGVTKATWEAWVRRPASESEMRNLTVEKVKPLYKQRYWDAVKGDELPPAVAMCVFDFGVNAGPARAIRYLQAVVGATQDGIIGPATLEAVNKYVSAHGADALVRAYQDKRRDYYRSLSTFGTFGRGWLRRVDEVEQKALAL
jgi:lysozyme family protein